MTRVIDTAAQDMQSLLQGEDGSSLVEVALSLMLLLSMVLAIIGMAQLAYAQHFVTFAARQGTRYAMVRGSTFAAVSCSAAATLGCQAAASDIASYVRSQITPGLTLSNMTVLTSWPGLAGSGLSCLALAGANSPGCMVQVTVRYTFSFGLPFLPSQAMTLQSTSQTSILQ